MAVVIVPPAQPGRRVAKVFLSVAAAFHGCAGKRGCSWCAVVLYRLFLREFDFVILIG